jgi:hypothetical protein
VCVFVWWKLDARTCIVDVLASEWGWRAGLLKAFQLLLWWSQVCMSE